MIVELRLLIVEVKNWRSGGSLLRQSKFNNHHSSINHVSQESGGLFFDRYFLSPVGTSLSSLSTKLSDVIPSDLAAKLGMMR
jgi:hypothetical protein